MDARRKGFHGGGKGFMEAEEAKAAAVKKVNLRGACIVDISEVADSPPLVIIRHNSLQA